NPAQLDAGFAILRSLDVPPRASWQPHRISVPQGCWVEPVPSRAKDISRNFHRLAAFNRDAALNQARLLADLTLEQEVLTAAAKTSGLPDKAATTLLDTLLPIVVRADHLAVQYRELRQFCAQLWPFTAALVVTMMA